MQRFSQPVPAVPRQTVSRSGAKVEKENQRQPKNPPQSADRPRERACRSFVPGKTSQKHPRIVIRKKKSPEVRCISFILYNRPSPVRLGMVLHPFIPPLFHHRIISWNSQWTGIRSRSRRSRERSQRVECLLERRRRLRQLHRKFVPVDSLPGDPDLTRFTIDD